MHEYVKAVCAHIKETGPLAPGYRVDTVYFGGGTPSAINPLYIAKILEAAKNHFDVAVSPAFMLYGVSTGFQKSKHLQLLKLVNKFP